jgi:hypothetical protein
VSLWRTKRAWIETGGILQPTTAFGARGSFDKQLSPQSDMLARLVVGRDRASTPTACGLPDK